MIDLRSSFARPVVALNRLCSFTHTILYGGKSDVSVLGSKETSATPTAALKELAQRGSSEEVTRKAPRTIIHSPWRSSDVFMVVANAASEFAREAQKNCRGQAWQTRDLPKLG